MKYYAFLSYSHHDYKFALDLHRKIESYKIPKMVSSIKRLYPVFIDREELQPCANLPQSLKDRLEESQNLIVISSIHSRDSYWVNEEVKYFKSIGRSKDIIIVYLDKLDSMTDIVFSSINFPKALVKKVDERGNLLEEDEAQPLFLKFTSSKKNNRKNFIKIIAKLLKLEIALLENRDELARKNKVLLIILFFSGLLLAFTIAIYQWYNNILIQKKLVYSNYENEKNKIMLDSAKQRAELAAKIASDLAKKNSQEKK